MISRRPVRFSNEYLFAGDEEDRYFAMLPEHDLSALYNYLNRRKGDLAIGCALDIGANIGLSAACICDLYPQARITAFEPGRQTFRLLAENMQDNGLSERVHCEQLAVGARSGQMGFDDTAAFTAGNKLSTTAGDYSVEVVTLDEYVARHEFTRLDFVKIDVEGHEIPVLEAARDSVSRFRPVFFFECNPYALYLTGATLGHFLEAAMDMVGALGLVDRLSGEVELLPAAPEGAERALLSHSTSDYDVFDLVTLGEPKARS